MAENVATGGTNVGGGTGEVVSGGVPDSGTPKPVSLKDDDLVEVVWKGQTVTKPWKEARNNIQMQEDYTRSKQELSTKAKEVQDLYDSLTARDKEIREKETALDAILGRAPKGQGKEELAPDATPTVSQIKEMLNEQLQSLESRLSGKVEQTTKQTEEARLFQRWEDLTNDAADRLVKEHPILAKVPLLAEALKKAAYADKPTSEKEMVASIVKAGKRLAQTFDEEFTARKKADAIKRDELKTKGPEAPGGGPSLTVPSNKSYMKGRNKIDFDSIERDAVAAIEAMDE